MAASPFLALLRGVNVGGRNIILKDALIRCFEDLGFTGVRTYIQSGNVLFRSDETNVRAITDVVEKGLSDRCSARVRAVVFPRSRYRSAVRAAPPDWGRSETHRHNALFTLRGITPAQALAQLPPPKADLETLSIGPGVIFWSASRQALTRTTWMRLAAAPVYQQVTIRNHRTVLRLLELFEES